jgi:hypothetical protein
MNPAGTIGYVSYLLSPNHKIGVISLVSNTVSSTANVPVSPLSLTPNPLVASFTNSIGYILTQDMSSDWHLSFFRIGPNIINFDIDIGAQIGTRVELSANDTYIYVCRSQTAIDIYNAVSASLFGTAILNITTDTIIKLYTHKPSGLVYALGVNYLYNKFPVPLESAVDPITPVRNMDVPNVNNGCFGEPVFSSDYSKLFIPGRCDGSIMILDTTTDTLTSTNPSVTFNGDFITVL